MFQDIDITAEVLDLFQLYLGCSKLDDIIYDNMVCEFIKHNRFKLLTGNGESNFIAIKSFYFHARECGFPFLGFQDNTRIDMIEYPADWMARERYPFMWSFVFTDVRGKGLEQLKNAGWKGDAYRHSNTTGIQRGSQTESVNESLIRGNNVLWAPTYPVYGMYSMASFIEDNRTIIKNLDKQSCLLKVKYHIDQKKEQIKLIQAICQECKNEWIDQENAIEPYIEWADIVFTTLSTVIFDAMLQGKFIVCVIDDLGWKYVGDLNKYCYMVSREEVDYDKILYDIDFRKQWIQKQNVFVDMLQSTENDVSIAEVLKKYIYKVDEEKCIEG